MSKLDQAQAFFADVDGWVRIRVTKGKGGGGKRGRPSKAADIDDGVRGLWVYFYPDVQPPEPPQLQLVA